MGSHTVDIKLAFLPYDCVPGPACREFRRNLLQLGAKTDDRGYSLADCFLRQDEGAADQGTDVPGVPHVLAATAPGPLPAGVGHDKARIARVKRLKDSAAFLVQHISDGTMKQILAQPHLGQNGPEMFDHVMSTCLIPLTGSELHELRAKVLGLTVRHDVGFSENTVLDLIKTARVQNLLLAPNPVSDDELAEMVLDAISKASAHLSESALDELNAPAGLPLGGLGVRRFQLPVPPGAPAGTMPLRDLNSLVAAFHGKWRGAVRAGRIEKRGVVARTMLETGRSATAAPGRVWPQNPTPQQTLHVVRSAGLEMDANTVTTTDWACMSSSEVAKALDVFEDDEGGETCEVVMAVDAGDAPVIELLCRNCRGAGHLGRDCPSPRRYRSLDYAAELIAAAKGRAGPPNRGGMPGGRRAPMRGQLQPMQRQMPRQFSEGARTRGAAPFRRFTPANRQTARVAEETAEEEESGGEAEAAGAVRVRPVGPPAETPAAETAASAQTEGAAESVAAPESGVATPTQATFAGTHAYYDRMAERGRPAGAALEKARQSHCHASKTAATDRSTAGRRDALTVACVLAALAFLGFAAAITLGGDTVIAFAATALAVRAREGTRAVLEVLRNSCDAPSVTVMCILIAFLVGRTRGAVPGGPGVYPTAVSRVPPPPLLPALSMVLEPGRLPPKPVLLETELLPQKPVQPQPDVIYCRAGTARTVNKDGISECPDSGTSAVIPPTEDQRPAEEAAMTHQSDTDRALAQTGPDRAPYSEKPDGSASADGDPTPAPTSTSAVGVRESQVPGGKSTSGRATDSQEPAASPPSQPPQPPPAMPLCFDPSQPPLPPPAAPTASGVPFMSPPARVAPPNSYGGCYTFNPRLMAGWYDAAPGRSPDGSEPPAPSAWHHVPPTPEPQSLAQSGTASMGNPLVPAEAGGDSSEASEAEPARSDASTDSELEGDPPFPSPRQAEKPTLETLVAHAAWSEKGLGSVGVERVNASTAADVRERWLGTEGGAENRDIAAGRPWKGNGLEIHAERNGETVMSLEAPATEHCYNPILKEYIATQLSPSEKNLESSYTAEVESAKTATEPGNAKTATEQIASSVHSPECLKRVTVTDSTERRMQQSGWGWDTARTQHGRTVGTQGASKPLNSPIGAASKRKKGAGARPPPSNDELRREVVRYRGTDRYWSQRQDWGSRGGGGGDDRPPPHLWRVMGEHDRISWRRQTLLQLLTRLADEADSTAAWRGLLRHLPAPRSRANPTGWTEKLDGAWRRWLLNLIVGNNQRGWGERKTRLDHVELMNDILYILTAHVDVCTELRFDQIIRVLIEWRSHFLNSGDSEDSEDFGDDGPMAAPMASVTAPSNPAGPAPGGMPAPGTTTVASSSDAPRGATHTSGGSSSNPYESASGTHKPWDDYAPPAWGWGGPPQ